MTLGGRGLGADYTRLWTAGAVSMLGDGVVVAAVPLLAAALSTDPRQVALVTTCIGLPWLLLSLPAGAVADRVDRRRLVVAAQGVQLAVVSALAVVVALHAVTIWLLCAMGFGLAAAETVFRAAGESLVPSVVAPEHLVRANGRQQAAIFVNEESLGPPAGAALFAVSASLPFWVDALTFAASMLVLRAIRPRPEFRPRAAHASLRADLRSGLRWLRRNELIRLLVGLAALANFTTFMVMSTIVLFARDELHLSEVGYGLLLSGMAVGGVVGSLVSNKVVGGLGLRATIQVLPLVAPLVFLAVALASSNAIAVGVLLALSSFALSLWNVVSFTLRQLHVPSEMLGRVGGAAKTISFGVGPLGSLAGGFIAHQWGLVAPWIVAGVVRLALAVPAVARLRAMGSVAPPPVPARATTAP